MSRPEVFDVRCRLHFYDSPEVQEQRFLAVPDDSTFGIVLRGVLKARIPPTANRGRLYGIRKGLKEPLWPTEADKICLINGIWHHDLVEYCIWEPDKVEVPDRVAAYWPGSVTDLT